MQELYYNGFEDAVSVLRPVTKGTWMLMRPDTAIDVLNQAYKTAVSGRPGPVFIQIPFDVQLAAVEGTPEPPSSRLVSSRLRADAAAVGRSAELLRQASRPVIVAGGGCKQSAGSAELIRQLAETTRTPVATTLTAKGVFPKVTSCRSGRSAGPGRTRPRRQPATPTSCSRLAPGSPTTTPATGGRSWSMTSRGPRSFR